MFNHPTSPEKVKRIIGTLELPAGAKILDVGCGRGEFLLRVLESVEGHGLGIDSDPVALADAKKNVGHRIPNSSCEFREANVRTENFQEDSFDLAMCIGSTHAFGDGEAGYPNTIQKLSECVRPGGLVLVGEGYWKQPPASEYLALIGEPVGIYRNHRENISFAEEHGLVALYAAVSNDDEWDHFEWSYRMKIERESMHSLNEPGVAEKLTRSREWRNGYLQWGRSTMGFGFYLFLKPLLSRS